MGMKATFILKQIQNSIEFEERKKKKKQPQTHQTRKQAFKMPSLMQPKKKISGGGFQLKESGIKSSLVSIAVFSLSHTHACTCVCSFAPKESFPYQFSAKVCADA